MQWNRAWLFFVIVAVGLVLSWGQVGRKATDALSQDQSLVLQTERPCAPRQMPCAAYGDDRAVVLGPAGGAMLQLRAIGQPGLQLRAAVLQRRRAGASERTALPAERTGPEQWQITLPGGWSEEGGGELELRLDGPPTTAVFPLR